MKLPVTVPPDLERFIQEELAEGDYESTDEIVSEALRLLQWKRRHGVLREEIRIGLDQVERGEVAPLDMDEIRAAAIAYEEAGPGMIRAVTAYEVPEP